MITLKNKKQSTVVVEYFKTSWSVIDRQCKQKIKDIVKLSSNTHQINLIDIYKIPP